jgi:aminobenzoyl-glutamate utilization protein B
MRSHRIAPVLRLVVWALACVTGHAQLAAGADRHDAITARVDRHADEFGVLAHRIWELAEPGYQEVHSSALLAEALRQAGFTVREGVADIPTAFVAQWGTGKPVIGIIGEYDALPGLSQEVEPLQKARVAGAYGHGCGHNLLGAGSALTAIAVKESLEAEHRPGTVRFYGTPAEEGGAAKVFMIRAGLFANADVVLHWHPGDRNIATNGSTLAIIGAKFRFHGRAAHAAMAPEMGRSALDAALLTAHAVDMLREHVPQETRVHYVLPRAGDAPNIVPAEAELYLYARHPKMDVLDGIWQRVVKCAEAGALATETTMTMELVGSEYELLPNDALSGLIDRHLRTMGGISYTPDEQA